MRKEVQFKLRRRNVVKSKKKCSKFHRRASLHDRVFKLILHARAKLPSFSTTLAVILSAVALPMVPKVEFNFEAIMYFTIFIFESPAALSPWSVFKTHLQVHRSSCFRGSWKLEKFFTRKVWGFCTPWSSILRPRKHQILFLSLYFKSQSSNFSVLGIKTRPLKFVDFARSTPW